MGHGGFAWQTEARLAEKSYHGMHRASGQPRRRPARRPAVGGSGGDTAGPRGARRGELHRRQFRPSDMLYRRGQRHRAPEAGSRDHREGGLRLHRSSAPTEPAAGPPWERPVSAWPEAQPAPAPRQASGGGGALAGCRCLIQGRAGREGEVRAEPGTSRPVMQATTSRRRDAHALAGGRAADRRGRREAAEGRAGSQRGRLLDSAPSKQTGAADDALAKPAAGAGAGAGGGERADDRGEGAGDEDRGRRAEDRGQRA